MKKFNKKQMDYLNDNFNIYEDSETVCLESWTDGGVDMTIYIDKRENIDYLQQLVDYYNDFDIDDEIEIYRQNEEYRRNFKITESVKDFADYLEFIDNVIIELGKLQ